MNYKQVSRILLCICLLTVLSCDKSVDDLAQKDDISTKSSARTSKEPFDFKNNKHIPVWEEAVYLKDFIEVPYRIDGKRPIPKSEKGSFKNQGRERLLITNKGAEFNVSIVRYIPSPSYKGNIGKINIENFAESKFDGTITLQTIGESSFQTWKIQNGKIVKRSNVGKINTKKNGRYVVTHWSQDTDWYQWSGSEWVYLYTTTEFGQDQSWDDDDNLNGNGVFDCSLHPNDPGCGGGSGGSAPTYDNYMNDPTFAAFLIDLNADRKSVV